MSIAELPPQIRSKPVEPPQIVETPRRPTLTVEQAIYIVLFALSLLVHLWGLDNRALHHDETLHARFSYNVMAGQGFIHDPLLHGPFLYFWGAFVYFLFGDTNYTARLAAALFGSVLTVLPFFLRRDLGRGAALLASMAMLISPVFLYVGRFIRHDIYAVTFELLVFICIVRYTSTRRAIWLFIGAGALALMFTTMETFFLYVAMFLPVVFGAFFWRVWRPGAALVGAVGLGIVLLVFVLPGHAERPFRESDTVNRVNGPYVCPSQAEPFPPANPMLVEKPGLLFGLPPLATNDNSYALCVRHEGSNDFGLYFIKLSHFFSHPAILAALVLVIGGAAILYMQIWRQRDSDGLTRWERARATGDTLLEVFASLRYGRRWLVALGIFILLYALFFTAFFTNPVGIISGTTGSLLYWLAQHEVERGSQPRHFYLVLLAIYEPLVLLWSVVGFGMVGTMLVRRLRAYRNRSVVHDAADQQEQSTDGEEQLAQSNGSVVSRSAGQPVDWSFALPVLLAYWSLATLFIYSWAGEKMPWLTIHVALPLTLFAAWALARVLGWWYGSFRSNIALTGDSQELELYTQSTAGTSSMAWGRALTIYFVIFGAVVALCFLLVSVSIRAGGAQLAFVPWVLPVGLTLIALLTGGSAILLGPRWAFGTLALAITLTGALYSTRSAFQLSFRWGDVPREMMIYTQTSPEVADVIERLTMASIRRGGDMDLPIWYDNETVWDWYMRRFTAAVEQPAGVIPAPPEELQAMLLMQENLNELNQQSLQGFRVQRYPLRWWFPEDQMYRLPEDWMTRPVTEDSPLLMRILRTPFEGTTAADFWDYMLFRNLPAPLGSSDFSLAIRPELADEFGLGTGEQK